MVGKTFVLLGVCAANAAGSDVVIDWNNQALNSIAATSMPPPQAARAMAMVQAAVYDAVNSVNPVRRGYYRVYSNPAGTSAEAAAAQAAHDVLTQIFPGRAAQFDAQLSSSLAGIPDGAAKAAGVTLGSQSAAGIASLRANDHSNDVTPYTPAGTVGHWRPTPPAGAPALLPNWPAVTPFAMSSGSQFRPSGPPSLTSQEYTDSFNEVKALGSVNSAMRTPEQTDIALMWAAGAGTVTPPGMWNQIAQQVATTQNLSLGEQSRLFALLNLGLGDAAIAAWDCKYTADLWRPVTAIRDADLDGNPDTVADPSWTPLLVTPPFPSYTSGHSTFSAAGATILADFLGTDSFHFTASASGISREFDSFAVAAAEAGQSRIYGGIHWQFDNQVGLHCGAQVGEWVSQTQLQVPSPMSALVLACGLAVRRRRR